MSHFPGFFSAMPDRLPLALIDNLSTRRWAAFNLQSYSPCIQVKLLKHIDCDKASKAVCCFHGLCRIGTP